MDSTLLGGDLSTNVKATNNISCVKLNQGTRKSRLNTVSAGALMHLLQNNSSRSKTRTKTQLL